MLYTNSAVFDSPALRWHSELNGRKLGFISFTDPDVVWMDLFDRMRVRNQGRSGSYPDPRLTKMAYYQPFLFRQL
jgi:hypothetical protein